jgi:hypothetical protein
MGNTRKADRKSKKNTRKQSGGKRAMTPWNKHVKRIFEELRRKDRSATFSDALKEASKRKNEM